MCLCLACHSCVKTNYGLLSDLVVGTRGPPLAPDSFDELISNKQFTNGADVETVRGLYRKTATTILGSSPALEFSELKWRPDEWAHLCAALVLCSRLEEFRLVRMGSVGDALRHATLPPSLKLLSIMHCTDLTALPEALSQCVHLTSLEVGNCPALTSLPALDGCLALKRLDLHDDTCLEALPPLSALSCLDFLDVQDCTSLTALPELPAAVRRFEANGCAKLVVMPPNLGRLSGLRRLGLRGLTLAVPVDLSALEHTDLKVDIKANERAAWGLRQTKGIPRDQQKFRPSVATSVATLRSRKGTGEGVETDGSRQSGNGASLARFLRQHSETGWRPPAGRREGDATTRPQVVNPQALVGRL